MTLRKVHLVDGGSSIILRYIRKERRGEEGEGRVERGERREERGDGERTPQQVVI